MKILNKLVVASTVLSLTLLGGCATGTVSPSDRDTSGAYDGVWVGTVAKPRSSVENLPNNWRMTCEWKPHEIYLVVDDGRMQLGKLEQRTLVSTTGKFKIRLDSGAAKMSGGVMPGNGKIVQVFSGSLAGEDPRGKYLQVISNIGNGCNSKIRFRRYSESEA